MAETIRDVRVLPIPPSVSITVTPTPASESPYTIGGQTFPYSSTPPSYAFPINATLTMTANVKLHPEVNITEYHWDFGDGGEAYGPQVDYMWRVAASQTRLVLCVTDNFRRKVCRGLMVNLYPATAIIVSSGAAGAPV